MHSHATSDSGDGPLDKVAFMRDAEALRPALRAYVLAMFPHPHQCEDIVQETMIFAWERRIEFTQGTSLKAWLFKAAYFKTLAQRRDAMRDKTVTFSDAMLQTLAGAAETPLATPDERMAAMDRCLGTLDDSQLALLRHKYLERGSLSELARSRKIDENRLQKALSRIRLALRHCIENKLGRHS
jgi:RNA polymerase sigma-70 factor (ECF subfamily)